jgi:putative membrane protein
MQKDPYSEFDNKDLILRDRLANARTVLANERTFLAYIRTALSLVAAGAFFIKFLPTMSMLIVGWGLVALGVAAFGVGVYRHRQMKAAIREMNR